jgi:hypothetical protein
VRDREVRQHERSTGRCSDPKSARVFSFTSCSTYARQTRVRWVPPRSPRGRVEKRSGRGACARMRRGGAEAIVSRVFGRSFRSRRALDAVRRTRARTNRSAFRCGHCEVTVTVQTDHGHERTPWRRAAGPASGRARRDRSRGTVRARTASPAPPAPPLRPGSRAPPSRPFEKMPLARAPVALVGSFFRFFLALYARSPRRLTRAPFRSVLKTRAFRSLAERFSCRSRACWSWRRR